MADGWFVFAVVGSVILFAVTVLAVAMLRAAWMHREREALTASDLRAVEESALMLIEQLKLEADKSISDIDARCVELRELLEQTGKRISELRSLESALPHPVQNELPYVSEEIVEFDEAPETARVLRLASEGLDCVEIARATGLDCADVKVALKLGALAVGGLPASRGSSVSSEMIPMRISRRRLTS